MSRVIPLLPLWAFMVCSRVNFTLFVTCLFNDIVNYIHVGYLAKRLDRLFKKMTDYGLAVEAHV
jgi:hypothetical protein